MLKGFTEGLQRRLRRLNIGFVPKRRETLYTNLCKMKTKVDFDYCKDVVYSIPCRDSRISVRLVSIFVTGWANIRETSKMGRCKMGFMLT